MLGHTLVLFNILRNLYTIFHSGCTSEHSHQQYVSVPSFSTSSTTFFVFFLMVTIVTVVKWYLIAVLICIFLLISDVEQLFMCLLAVCMSSLEKCIFRSSGHFLIALLVFLMLNCILYELFTSFKKYFLPFCRLSFCFVTGFFCCAKAF